MSNTESKPLPPRRRSRPRRILRGIGITLVVLVVLVLIPLLGVLFTATGTELAVRRFVSWYSGGIAGSVQIERIDGALARGVSVTGLRLQDRNDDPLIVLDRVHLDLRALSLVRGAVVLDEADLDGLQVHLWPGRPGFEDLSRKPDAPKKGPPGPDLRFLEVNAEDLDVDDVLVVQHQDGYTNTLVSDAYLRGALQATEQSAELEVDALWGSVPAAQVEIAALQTRLDWSSPTIEVERLQAVTSAGIVHDLQAELQTLEQRFSVNTEATVFPGALGVEQAPLLAVDVQGGGLPSSAWVLASVGVPGDVTTTMSALGSWSPQPSIVGVGTAWARLETWLEGAPPVELAYLLAARGDRQDLDAVVVLGCASCVEPLGVALTAEGDDGDIAVDARPMIPGAEVDVSLALTEDGWQRAEAQVEVEEASRVARALEPFVDLPEVGGALTLVATCRPTDAGPQCEADITGRDIAFEEHRVGALQGDVKVQVTQDEPRIQADLDARDVKAGATTLDEVEITAEGTPESLQVDATARQGERRLTAQARIERQGEATTIEMQKLKGSIPGLDLQLERPASVRIEPDAIVVDALSLRVGEGRVKVDGRLAWRGRSDVQASLRNVQLQALADHLVPDLDLAGTVNGQARIEGRARAPSIDLRLALDDLQLRGMHVGDARVSLEQDEGKIAFDVLATRDGAKLRMGGTLPMSLDLSQRELDIAPREDVTLVIAMQRVRLRTLDMLPVPMRGQVEGELVVSGTLAEPVLVGRLKAFHLQVRDMEVGNVRLDLAHRDRVARANLLVVSDLARRLEVSARVPVRWSVQPLQAGLAEQGRYTAALDAEQLDLHDFDALLPSLGKLGGRADVKMTAQADGGQLRADLRVLAVDLQVRGQEIGSVQATAELGQGTARAHLLASGPALRLIEARAKVPLGVTVTPKLAVHWDPEEHHVVYAELRDVQLSSIGAIVGVPATGEVEGTIMARGRNDSLRAGVDLVASPLGYGGKDLGDATLAASWDGEALYTSFTQARNKGSLVASAMVPLRLDPAQRRVRWLDDRPHRVDLIARGVDEEMIEAFVSLPRTWDFEASMLAAASGTPRDPKISARLRGRFQGEEDIETAAHVALKVRGDRVWSRLMLGANGGSGLTARARTQLPLLATIRGEAELADAPLLAELAADDFPLRDLDPLLPAALHDVQGTLTASASATGALLRPELEGAIDIQDGAVTVVPLNQRFDHVQLLAQLQGPNLEIAQLRFDSGEGEGTGSGWLHMAKGETKGELVLATDELPVVKPGLPLMKLDTRVEAKLDATGALTLIDVDIHDTFIDVLDTELDKVEPIPEHPGVYFVDAAGRRERELATRKAEAAGPEEAQAEPWLPAPMKVVITVQDPVVVKGSSIDMAWDGRVVAVHRQGQPLRARGQIEVDRGRVALLGQEFEIEQGQIFLPDSGELDPYIALRAVTDIDDATVTMQVRGRASRPDLIMSSSPPMAQSDIFALLITGKADSGGADGENFGAKAASLLAAFNNPALQRELHDRIGIDRVGVGFGETVEQPILSVGKRFGRNVYVETSYHHNAPRDENEAEVRLEYFFRPPAWSIETFFGDAAAGGVALWWRRAFGMPFDDERGRGRASGSAEKAQAQEGRSTSDLARAEDTPRARQRLQP